ncbi:hypothetical protein Anas_09217, partial [Armadillidium nasatum]
LHLDQRDPNLAQEADQGKERSRNQDPVQYPVVAQGLEIEGRRGVVIGHDLDWKMRIFLKKKSLQSDHQDAVEVLHAQGEIDPESVVEVVLQRGGEDL